MNERTNHRMTATVNFSLHLTSRVDACRSMLTAGVPREVIIRVLSHPSRRRS